MNKTDEIRRKAEEIRKGLNDGTLSDGIITPDTYIPAVSSGEVPRGSRRREEKAPKRAVTSPNAGLVGDFSGDGTSDRIVELLYGADIHDTGLKFRAVSALERDGLNSLGIIADTAREELENVLREAGEGALRSLEGELKKYHVDILREDELRKLPEAERLKREYRKLRHLYDEAKSSGEYYEQKYRETFEELHGPDRRLRDKTLGEGRDMLRHNPLGLAELLDRMIYGGDEHGCRLCEILRLAEWGSCRQRYDTCRECIDGYLRAYYTTGDRREAF